uniref:Deacetylase sirtuin-type domain-containing protein n=1 Tax=Chromera velia CCMP2878 TaxID=1169474 RepID=A0A0G4H329_9ALVE|eukprot:Cvel_5588.t1-p1 / transcript=Cvel_5588.t1 / gene=Cvel_5588 / organism=Chromera_velia_CCMP2878 / gene_product=hypothetical protein / transcript_product=hypothetical protein / location=Cvel_scaffold263:6235-31027(+) / protein_length=563 / sequence_SO=supercontig / SO=protein_coding / is_pseudo=false
MEASKDTTLDDQARLVATKIWSCDFLLIAAGAGFSADSGLPVYADITKDTKYAQSEVNYGDLASADAFVQDPNLCAGFWGSWHQRYKETPPHEGYRILERWCRSLPRLQNRLSPTGPTCTSLRRRPPPSGVFPPPPLRSTPPSEIALAGGEERGWRRWYVYTSNVDGAFRKFPLMSSQLCEIHGCVEEWCCSAFMGRLPSETESACISEEDAGDMPWPPPSDVRGTEVWREWNLKGPQSPDQMARCSRLLERPPASSAWAFKPDPHTLLLSSPAGKKGPSALPSPSSDDGNCRVGESSQAGIIPATAVWGDGTVLPFCDCCALPLRPHVLLFNDTDPVVSARVKAECDVYQEWEEAVESELCNDDRGDFSRLVILELGCGVRVPSVRRECENVLVDASRRLLKTFEKRTKKGKEGGKAQEEGEGVWREGVAMIRVNPDFPDFDDLTEDLKAEIDSSKVSTGGKFEPERICGDSVGEQSDVFGSQMISVHAKALDFLEAVDSHIWLGDGRTINEEVYLNHEENNAFIVQGDSQRQPRTRKTRSAVTAYLFMLVRMTNRPERSLR